MSLLDTPGVKLVKFDQCVYHLQLSGAPKYVYCKKTTAILSNVKGIESIIRRCPGFSREHMHERAWGSRVVKGVNISLAASAGRYPPALCEALAEVIRKAW